MGAYAQTKAAGVREVSVQAMARDDAIRVMVWYPSKHDGPTSAIDSNAVFAGAMGQLEASLAPGQFPLVLISHGGFRAAPVHAGWLASALASRGNIVAVVTPPKAKPGPPPANVLSELVLRPQDLSATLTELKRNTTFKAHIDFDRVGAVGFFLGGYAVLALAGLELDPDQLAKTCQPVVRSVDCRWLRSGGINMQTTDLTPVVRSVQDSRIKAVVAIDPEWMHGASPSGLARIETSTHILNVGESGSTGNVLNGASVSRGIRGATYSIIKEAGRFSSFSICQDKGPAILKAEGEDSDLCTDGKTTRPRTQIHQELVMLISNKLAHGFSR